VRRDAVVQAFLHSWRAYEAGAFGSDELQPLTNKSNEHWGGFGVSLVDGLDTAMLMKQHGIVQRAIRWVDEGLHFDRDHYISVFEMTIRVLGGLISSYDLSGDKRLLAKAVHVADRMLPAFRCGGALSPTSPEYHCELPSPQLNLRTGEVRARGARVLAEVGSVQLEYARLHAITRDPRYAAVAATIRLLQPHPNGLFPRHLEASPTYAEYALNGGAKGNEPTCAVRYLHDC